MDDLELHDAIRSTVTAYGSSVDGLRVAHADSPRTGSIVTRTLPREEREQRELSRLAGGATASKHAGNRLVEEEADPFALCFEVDVERIRTAPAFRRMAGKAQVFVAPKNDMLRNRLTHVLEVAQLATRVSSILGLNVSLTEAIALGHDCGHGPGGHPAEEAFSTFVPGGFDHAVWGADVVLSPLNLCLETLDGVRNHSWKRPVPSTPEAMVVAWSDRCSYVVHDFDDALRAGILSLGSLPKVVAELAGVTQHEQLSFFARELVHAASEHGAIGMREESAVVLDAFRTHNFEKIYLRPASLEQSAKVVRILGALVEYYVDAPGLLPVVADGSVEHPGSGSSEAARLAVAYVASMTDRYAFGLAGELLGFSADQMPKSV